MRLPTIQGVIRRRILVNYRVDPNMMERFLPARFKPMLHRGFAVAGICLIRLEHIRPAGLPEIIGLSSENAAHRVAVCWTDESGNPREGVFIPRRDTSSQLNHWLGGRVFPGVHHKAHFSVRDDSRHIDLAMRSNDRAVVVEVTGDVAASLPPTSMFDSVATASSFFERGTLGYSPSRNPCRFDGIVLDVERWHVEPLAVTKVCSSFFDDASLFPRGSVEFDHALVMRDAEHRWHSAADIVA